MKITLRFGEESSLTPSSSDTMVKISRIINQLRLKNIKEFMLIVDLFGTVDNEWNKEITAYCNKNKNELFIGEIEEKTWKVAISNKGCDLVANDLMTFESMLM